MKEVILYLDKGEITGAYSQSLEDAVNKVKTSEERRVEYMTMMVPPSVIIEVSKATKFLW